MTVEQLSRRNWFPLLLVALHSLLVVTWAWIELDHAWNDMNVTMLVMAALYIIDYPIHCVLHPMINNVEQTGTYLAATLVFGGAFWFAVGKLIQSAGRAVLRITVGRKPISNGA